MSNGTLSRQALAKRVYSRLLIGVPALLIIFFLPAGTLAYWEAWLYLATLLIPMFLTLHYLLRHDLELLERRMRMREKEREQKLVVRISYLYYAMTFLLPGFDRRWEWSHVPIAVVVLADLVVLLGYGLFALVLRENSYASRTVQVDQGQRVISSGPYAIVRHPMYLGIMLLYVASPLALGSYWAVLPAVMIIPLLVARILSEEKVLRQELPGYTEYMRKTVYRLVPGIW